ncbi:MAG: hypothetical protein K2Q14_06490, partial [Gammaproteobacteria bacterium]|nr:hypothetical protein [Gammaproteobacteria bacterium]
MKKLSNEGVQGLSGVEDVDYTYIEIQLQAMFQGVQKAVKAELNKEFSSILREQFVDRVGTDDAQIQASLLHSLSAMKLAVNKAYNVNAMNELLQKKSKAVRPYKQACDKLFTPINHYFSGVALNPEQYGGWTDEQRTVIRKRPINDDRDPFKSVNKRLDNLIQAVLLIAEMPTPAVDEQPLTPHFLTELAPILIEKYQDLIIRSSEINVLINPEKLKAHTEQRRREREGEFIPMERRITITQDDIIGNEVGKEIVEKGGPDFLAFQAALGAYKKSISQLETLKFDDKNAKQASAQYAYDMLSAFLEMFALLEPHLKLDLDNLKLYLRKQYVGVGKLASADAASFEKFLVNNQENKKSPTGSISTLERRGSKYNHNSLFIDAFNSIKVAYTQSDIEGMTDTLRNAVASIVLSYNYGEKVQTKLIETITIAEEKVMTSTIDDEKLDQRRVTELVSYLKSVGLSYPAAASQAPSLETVCDTLQSLDDERIKRIGVLLKQFLAQIANAQQLFHTDFANNTELPYLVINMDDAKDLHNALTLENRIKLVGAIQQLRLASSAAQQKGAHFYIGDEADKGLESLELYFKAEQPIEALFSRYQCQRDLVARKSTIYLQFSYLLEHPDCWTSNNLLQIVNDIKSFKSMPDADFTELEALMNAQFALRRCSGVCHPDGTANYGERKRINPHYPSVAAFQTVYLQLIGEDANKEPELFIQGVLTLRDMVETEVKLFNKIFTDLESDAQKNALDHNERLNNAEIPSTKEMVVAAAIPGDQVEPRIGLRQNSVPAFFVPQYDNVFESVDTLDDLMKHYVKELHGIEPIFDADTNVYFDLNSKR